MTSSRHQELARFVRTLEESLDWKFDHDEFTDRFYIQKYVFFADEYGFDRPYGYGIHLHGPYSPALAEDYYDEEFHSMLESTDPEIEGLQTSSFVDFIEGKRKEYLEVAATLKSITERHRAALESGDFSRDDIFKKVSEIKEVDPDEVEEIHDDLVEAGILG